MKMRIILPAILFLGFYSCSKPVDIVSGIPDVATAAIFAVTSYSASGGGTVISENLNAVTERGLCWSKNPNPTTADFKTMDGAGPGNYRSLMTDLLPNTAYYIRAYAKNSVGIAYGNELNITTAAGSTTTVTDIDANVYNIITIGTQTWMKENLKVSRYNNGDSIPTDLSASSWGTTTSGAFAIYDSDLANEGTYGKLYNWYAGSDSRKIAPPGWHVASKDEWQTLINFLGGPQTAAGELKEIGITHWATPNTGATNGSDFTALPSGTRLIDGSFSSIGTNGFWWTSTEYLAGSSDAEAILLSNNSAEAIYVTDKKAYGASIRCIKD
jgi:uncharacterized protein (TIGR02145 family)